MTTHKLDEAACRSFIARCLRAGKNGMLNDGGGLYLRARSNGSASWVRRYTFAGHDHEIGLGSYDVTTLAEVREKARTVSQQLAAGLDPLVERNQARFTGKATRTFRYCANEIVKEREPLWTNDKHRRDWEQSLERYVLPLIGDKPVAQIGQKDVLALLLPHWETHQVTMTRVRSRIELILAWAANHKYRPAGNNPARWRDGLDTILQISARPKKRSAPPGAPSTAPTAPPGAAVSLDDIAAVIRREMRAQQPAPTPALSDKEQKTLVRIADGVEDVRELVRRNSLDIKRATGLVEQPQTPRSTRRRPLGVDRQ